jgi:hypothetical protein
MSLQTTGASRESSLMSRQTLIIDVKSFDFFPLSKFLVLFLLIATILKIHLEHLIMLLIVKLFFFFLEGDNQSSQVYN